jgi:hypothetical protein
MATSFLNTLQHSGVSSLIESSRYISMGIQTFHVLGFTFLLAIIIAFNIRLQKIALGTQPVGRFTQSISRSYNAGLLVALTAGFLLFLPRAIAYGANWAFDYKLVFLAVAIVLQFLLQRRALALPEGTEASAPLRIVAALSLLLWFTVGAAGRAIGFV